MKVYCCFSLYHLYIAVAKAMVQNEKIDLVIGSQMPDYKNKIETIKSLDFINDIYDKLFCTKIRKLPSKLIKKSTEK